MLPLTQHQAQSVRFPHLAWGHPFTGLWRLTSPCPKGMMGLNLSRLMDKEKRLWPTRIKRLSTDTTPQRKVLIKTTNFKDLYILHHKWWREWRVKWEREKNDLTPVVQMAVPTVYTSTVLLQKIFTFSKNRISHSSKRKPGRLHQDHRFFEKWLLVFWYTIPTSY